MDVLVLVPWFLRGGQDGVPDYGFGGWVVGRAGGVDGFDVEEHLFGVPIVECGEICYNTCQLSYWHGRLCLETYLYRGRIAHARTLPSLCCSNAVYPLLYGSVSTDP